MHKIVTFLLYTVQGPENYQTLHMYRTRYKLLLPIQVDDHEPSEDDDFNIEQRHPAGVPSQHHLVNRILQDNDLDEDMDEDQDDADQDENEVQAPLAEAVMVPAEKSGSLRCDSPSFHD
jgi:hypothetical protein